VKKAAGFGRIIDDASDAKLANGLQLIFWRVANPGEFDVDDPLLRILKVFRTF